MSADAIVVAYRSGEVIADCLAALRRDQAVRRIVVVDNSGDADTARAVDGVPGTLLLRQRENVGFGRAVNAARRHVATDWVVLANPDAVQSPSTTGECLSFLRFRDQVGVLGPRMLRSDGSLFRNSQHDLGLLRLTTQSLLERHRPLRAAAAALRLEGAFGQQRSAAAHRTAHRTDYVIGSFVLCRTRALDQIGWFDESIFLFGEDQDLCRRMRQAGWEVWFAPVGEVTHAGGHSWRQLSDQGRAHFHQARYRELLRRRGRLQAEAYRHAYRTRAQLHRLLRAGVPSSPGAGG
jgi:N-acetylglucosaminyl-diphospho-decaprenol L-rhamnosyltransferase